MKDTPAFPVTSDNYANAESSGMTLRDYFAAKAMQTRLLDDSYDFSDRGMIAQQAYAYADAMMEARGQ
jgi:hypothetical protein